MLEHREEAGADVKGMTFSVQWEKTALQKKNPGLFSLS